MVHRLLVGALIFSCSALAVRADDWPIFRGPRRDGVSLEKGLLKQWPKDGPKLAWRFDKGGLGFSSLAIVGDTVYITGTRDDDKVEAVIAIDAKSGTELWWAKIGPTFTFKNNKWGDGPRGTPTVDGNLLFALGGQGELVCVDRTKKGEVIWRKNLINDLGGVMMTEWGYSESPLVDGDLVICTPGGPSGTLAALDKKTGAVQWRSKEIKNAAPYSSVVAADIHGVRQYIFNSYIDDTQGGVTSAVSARDGKLLWTMSLFEGKSFALAPTPIVKGNQVYMTSSNGEGGGGSHLFDIDKDMKATDLYPKKVRKNVKNSHGGVVLLGDFIFGHTDRDTWICQNFKTGELKWFDRANLSCPSGTLTAADGMLYLVTDKGEVALVEADPAAMNVVSTFQLPVLSKYPKTRPTSIGSKVWSHPVIANGRLYVRDCEYVYCYIVK